MKQLRQRLLAGETLLGSWLVLGSAAAAEIASQAGFDWLLIDMEHGQVDERAALGMMQAIEPSSASPVVRVLSANPQTVQRTLDMGAEGIMFPRLASAAEARAAAAAMRYQPAGGRGVARMIRATRFGAEFDEYFATCKDRLLGIVQIENLPALAEVDAIAAEDGVDVLFIGPSDLTMAMGIFRQFDHPRFREAIRATAEAARRHGKAAGALLSTADDMKMYRELGYRFLALGSDAGSIAAGAKGALEGMRRG